jgi:hypothetical protein
MTDNPLRAFVACMLGWLLPGAGHFYLGRRGKGAVFLVCLVAMFVLGLAMEAQLQSSAGLEDPLALLRSGAKMALGMPWLLARLLGLGQGLVTAPSHEYGNTFAEVAGLLNVLVVLDAFDIAVGRKR